MMLTRFFVRRLQPSSCDALRHSFLGTRRSGVSCSNQRPLVRERQPRAPIVRYIETSSQEERPARSSSSSSSPIPSRRPGESDGIEPMYDLDDDGNPILPDNDFPGDATTTTTEQTQKHSRTKIDAYELFRRRYYSGRSFAQAWETVYGYGDTRAWELTADGGVLEQALTSTTASYTLPSTVGNVLMPGCGVGHADVRVLVHLLPETDIIVMDISQGAIMLLSEHVMSMYQKNRKKLPLPKSEEKAAAAEKAAAEEKGKESSESSESNKADSATQEASSFEQKETEEPPPLPSSSSSDPPPEDGPTAFQPMPESPNEPLPLATPCSLVVGDFFSDDNWDSYYNYPEDAQVYEGEEEWEKEQLELEREREAVEEKYADIEYADDHSKEVPLPEHLKMKNNMTTTPPSTTASKTTATPEAKDSTSVGESSKSDTEDSDENDDGSTQIPKGDDSDVLGDDGRKEADNDKFDYNQRIVPEGDAIPGTGYLDHNEEYNPEDHKQKSPEEAQQELRDLFKGLGQDGEETKKPASQGQDGFDIIYDRHFFTYIPLRRRPEWGRRMYELLNPAHGRLITLIDTRPPSSKKGPPYPATVEDYRKVLEKSQIEMDGDVVEYDERYHYCVWKKIPEPESKPSSKPTTEFDDDEDEELEWM